MEGVTMHTREQIDAIRQEMTDALDAALPSGDTHAKEKVLVDFARRYGLRLIPMSETSIVLYEQGSVYAIQCDIAPNRRQMLLYTLELTEPLTV